ncbi:MerR family transcriptional regulator [Microbulbifer hainanensis]|uniref:MerR family transcriptional regulator n=1 Tax=Microbulbifer hainanensis TaxID=2735675 RepID=UPI0018694856|nr:MerR family transcriptional regulator [Microbulbifer hainanensis]
MSETDAEMIAAETAGMGSELPAGDAAVPIREVAQRTGVNPVTLRAWERRYGLLKPARTGKGHRLYSEDDVRRVEEILAWLARGVAIGKVRPLLDEGAPAAVEEDSWSGMVEATTVAVSQFAAPELQRQLEQLLSSYPLPLILDRWLTPVQRRLHRRERFGSSVAQGFFWQLLTEELAIVLRAGRKNIRQSGRNSRGKLLLVSFSGGEQQVFARLFCAALIAAGWDAVHLGPDVELGELAFAAEKLGADGVICYSHNALPMAVLGSGLERALRSLNKPLWLAGGIVELQRGDVQRLARHKGCRVLPAECDPAIRALREQLP